MRLIDADDLKEAVKSKLTTGAYYPHHFISLIDNAPTVEAYTEEQVKELVELNKKLSEERPQGEWVKDEEHSITIDMFRCSNCNGGGHTHFNFCPNCGADMRGKEE